MRHLEKFTPDLVDGLKHDAICPREPRLPSDICFVNEFYTRAGETGPVAYSGGQIAFDAASCGAAAVTLQTVPILDADLGDVVLFTPPAAGIGVAVLVGVGYVASAGSVRVPVVNPSAGALDPALLTYDYVLIKKPSPIV